jgi:hypothetical protein
MRPKTWKIFIVTHGPVRDHYYINDPDFLKEHFALFNVSATVLRNAKLEVINASNIDGYEYLGKWWAEAEAIYNVYKYRLYTDLDYVGFIHWDYELKSLDGSIQYNVCQAISNAIEQKRPFISFSTFDFQYAFDLNVMMDCRYPNQCYGNGKNCFDTILEDYNAFYKKMVTLEDLMDCRINLCSAFLVSKSVFEEMMPFYVHAIQKGFLNKFDTTHAYRFQGGMMERYIGVFSSQIKMTDIPLHHHYDHQKEATYIQLQIEKVRKFLSKIKKRLQ